jgi:hypothetical protein
MTVQLKDSAGTVIGSVNPADYLPSGGISTDWQTVIIPLAHLGVTSATVVSGVIIQSANVPPSAVYIDSVRFDNVGLSFPGNIYSEGAAPGWLNRSWAQNTFFGAGAGAARHGYKEIRAYFFNQWDGVYLLNQTGIPTSGFNVLSFSVKAMGTGFADLDGMQIQLRRPNETVISTLTLNPYLPNVTITGNTWYNITIPLTDFGAQNITLGGVVFMRSNPTYRATVWFDDINIATYRRYSASGNKRRNVVLEAFYALRPIHDGGCDKLIPPSTGDCVSSWNYINDDAIFGAGTSDYPASSYERAKGWYNCDSSVWWQTIGEQPCYNPNYPQRPVSFYNFVGNYGFGPWAGNYGAVGRGGQCMYFANLVLLRSGSHTTVFPGYANMLSIPNSELDLTKAIEGDIVLSSSVPHVAIVVAIRRNGQGVATDLDLIDANWVRDQPLGTGYREIIGRHILNISYLQSNGFKIWTRTAYYGDLAGYVAD